MPDLTDWWNDLDNVEHSTPRWARLIARILGPQRMTRFADWIEGYEARQAASRCEWRTALSEAQCTRKRGHRGLCRTEYANGNVHHWYGINYPDNMPL